MSGLLDFLLAAFDRASARGYEAEAQALWDLYQAAGIAILDPDPDCGIRVREALEKLARVNPRKARALRPHLEALFDCAGDAPLNELQRQAQEFGLYEGIQPVFP